MLRCFGEAPRARAPTTEPVRCRARVNWRPRCLARNGEQVTEPQTRTYRNGVLEAEGFPLSEVSGYLERPDTVVWIDFLQPSKAALEELAVELASNSFSRASCGHVGHPLRPLSYQGLAVGRGHRPARHGDSPVLAAAGPYRVTPGRPRCVCVCIATRRR